jgi:hypothetical protein
VSPPVLIATIEVVASDPQRIYLSGTRNSIAASGVEEMAITSHDMGATWTQSDVPALQGDLGAYLAGVDPTNADRVYVRRVEES